MGASSAAASAALDCRSKTVDWALIVNLFALGRYFMLVHDHPIVGC